MSKVLNTFVGVLVSAFGLSGSLAFADGFICESYAGNLRIKIFHQAAAVDPLPLASVMIVSDPARDSDRTIATFTSESALLTQDGTTYIGNVDLRYRGSNRVDQAIAGVKLGEVSQITLKVEYSFAQPLTDGAELPGEMIVSLRSGAPEIHLQSLCELQVTGEVSKEK